MWAETGITVVPEAHCGLSGWSNPYTCVTDQECVLVQTEEALEGALSFDNLGTSILTVCMVLLKVLSRAHGHNLARDLPTA